MTKSTLFSAASAAVILFAGAAQAQSISGSIGGVSFNDEAVYTLASELALDDALTTSEDGEFDVSFNLGEAIEIEATAPDVQYRVTFTIAGGEFDGASSASANSESGADVTFLTAGNTATTKTFIATVGSDVESDTAIEGFSLDTGLSIEDKTGVTITARVELLTSGIVTLVDSDTQEVVDFASVLGDFAVSGINTAEADLPDFETFNGEDSSATLAYYPSVETNEGSFYADLAGTAATADAIIDTVTVTIEGSQLDVLSPTLGGLQPDEDSVTASSAAFTFASVAALNNSEDDVFTVSNDEEEPVRIQAAEYTATATYEFNEGFEGPATSGPIDFGAIELEGTNFLATWVSGSQAQSQSTLRLSNTASADAVVSLRITNGVFLFNGSPTTFDDKDCASGNLTLPATGDLAITPALMTQCFGAFLRGDLQVTVQAEPDAITAKVRNTNAQGTFETTLGRFSGTDYLGNNP